VTEKLFTAPSDPRTEGYITGRSLSPLRREQSGSPSLDAELEEVRAAADAAIASGIVSSLPSPT